MISTEVDKSEFAEFFQADNFQVDPPATDLRVFSDIITIGRAKDLSTWSSIERHKLETIPTVEQTLERIATNARRQVCNYPESPKTHLNLAKALLNLGHVEEAIAELKSALTYSPLDYMAAATLAVTYFNVGNLEGAASLYDKLSKDFPRLAFPFLGMASISLREENFVAAASNLEAALKRESSAAASQILALVLIRMDKAHRAISVLRAALQKNVRSPDLHQTLAVTFRVAGDFHRAERSFKAALSLDPTHDSAAKGLATLFVEQHRYADAVDVLEKRVHEGPGRSDFQELLGRALVELKEYKQARSVLSAAYEELIGHPGKRDTLARLSNNIAYCLIMEDRVQDARSYFLRSIEFDHGASAIPFENLCRAHVSSRDFLAALDVADQAKSVGLSSIGLDMLCDISLVALGRHDEAISLLQQVTMRHNAPVEAYADLGWLLGDWKGDYDAALHVLRRGFEVDPKNTYLLNNLAYVHLMRGEIDAAASILAFITGDISVEEEVRLRATRGLLSLRQGDSENGEASYRSAEQLAAQIGNKSLMFAVRQKKYLEMAKMRLASGDIPGAKKAIELGLSVPTNQEPYPFRYDLKKLENLLEV